MSPVQEIHSHPGTGKNIRLLIKRDDLVHPSIQGNKWRKLEPVLKQLSREGAAGIISFGGPFSNHLHALAIAGKEYGIPTAAIVRGEYVDLNNPTLRDAAALGMELIPVPKSAYNEGLESAVIQSVIQKYPGYFCLPEGGSTPPGVRSCSRISTEILEQMGGVAPESLWIAVPAGTGCTAAGVVAGLQGRGQVLIFPAAPYGVDRDKIIHYQQLAGYPGYDNFRIMDDYTFGRFASHDRGLLEFARSFERIQGIRLDPIYTVKMMYGLYDLLEKDFFPPDSLIISIHTGGLQGWAGFL